MINPKNLQFGQMMVSAVRYAIGKRSYIVSETCDYIRPLITEMNTAILHIMRSDITKAAEIHNLGMMENRAEWMQLRADIVKEIERRERTQNARNQRA